MIAGYAIIVAGVLLMFKLSGYKPGDTPSTGIMILAVMTGFVLAAGGGYVAILVAPRVGMNPAYGLAGLVLVLGLFSMVAAWGREPAWFQVANVLVGVAGALLGGRIKLL